jgi:hypothetical protein
MSGNLYQAFGPELADQHRVQLERKARHDGLVRRLKRERKADRAHHAAEHGSHHRGSRHHDPRRRAPQACCAADVG